MKKAEVPNGDFGPNFGVHIHGSQTRTFHGSLAETGKVKGIKDHTKLNNKAELGKLSDPLETMLSSTMVTVLAPHWGSRLRRTKRFDETGHTEAHGNLQDVTNTMANHGKVLQDTLNQHGGEGTLTDGSHFTRRVPFLGTRRNTVGWSAKSDPSSLDFESKRLMTQAVSLDAGAMSPSPTTPSSRSPRFYDPNEQRRSPQAGQQGGLSSTNSKPTTSSLLLSLRRFNSSCRNLNTTSSFPETNHSHQSSSPNEQDRKLFTTHHSQSFLNNNEQERPNPLLSPSSISYRTTETGPVLSPASSNHRERNIPGTFFFSTSPINKHAEDNPFPQQLQKINRGQASLPSSKQTFQSEGPSEKQQGLDKSAKPLPDTSISRHSPYDHSTLVKTHSLPRRTTLTSTSWWKQVSQEGSSSLTLNNGEKPKMAIVPPFNHVSNKASSSLNDDKRQGSKYPLDIDNNNTGESFCKGNMSKTNSAESKSLVKPQYGSNLNREPQKPRSVPDVLSSSKISRGTTQMMLRHTKDPSKHDVSSASFAANVTEFPPTSINAKSSNPAAETNNKYKDDCPQRTKNTLTFPYNMDSQTFSKPSLSLDYTTSLNSQAHTSQAISGLAPAPSTKSTFSFVSHPAYPKTNAHASSQTPKSAKENNITPIGFERRYTCIPKPFHPKTVPSMIPTVNSASKNNFSPVCTSSTKSFTTPSSSRLSPSFTSAVTSPTSVTASSLLTPPATPDITSPNSKTYSPIAESIFPNNPEREPKKPLPGVEGKRQRQVKSEELVDAQRSQPVTMMKAEPPWIKTNPLSPPRFPPPSIFSFLRSSSPERDASPVCFPNPKAFSRQVGKDGKYRSFSSDSADLAIRERDKNKQSTGGTNIFDQGRQDSCIPRQERTLSVESGTVQCHSSAPLSLPPDFSSRYKLRYSSPPYSTLKSTRQASEELKTKPQRFPLFPQTSQANDIPKPSVNDDQFTAMTTSCPRHLLHSPSPPCSSIFQKTITMQGSSKCGLSGTDHVNKDNGQDHANTELKLLDNRVHISLQSLPGDKTNSSSTYVTETLVYSIKSKVDRGPPVPKSTTPKSAQCNVNRPVSVETRSSSKSHTEQSKEAGTQSSSQSDKSSLDSSSTDSRPCDYESSNRGVTESMLGKSRFYSVEVNNEQSPKKSRFGMKRSVSTPNSKLSGSESDRVCKSNNKMDQMLNKLRQKFSSRRSDDDSPFLWKWKRSSQTPSVSGSSDTSSVSDASADSTKTLEEQVQEAGTVLNDNAGKTDGQENRYIIVPPSTNTDTNAGYEFSIWSEKSALENDQDEQKACSEDTCDCKVLLTVHSPATKQLDLHESSGMDTTGTKHFFPCTDPNADRNPGTAYAAQHRKSTPSPRSPFSPFSSLSPLSPFPSPDVTDDSVFYSPKLQRRREPSSPCEPDGISLGSSRRIRLSTGQPNTSPGHDREHLASSYADLKYGIEPGRSFSVSSVLSSRPSGPGRISTGSRFMSVGDLSQSAWSCAGSSRDVDQSGKPDQTEELGYQPTNLCQVSDFSDPSKMRTRSLPRSLTRCLANWSSGIPISEPVSATASKSACLRSPNMNSCHFPWDAEGPPTPPPTPPLSPVTRCMSKPPSHSSSAFSSSSGALQQVDSQSSRGLLPSRGYVSSLSTFDESSDSSSDTTTDDEYYLDEDEEGEKETEL